MMMELVFRQVVWTLQHATISQQLDATTETATIGAVLALLVAALERHGTGLLQAASQVTQILKKSAPFLMMAMTTVK